MMWSFLISGFVAGWLTGEVLERRSRGCGVRRHRAASRFFSVTHWDMLRYRTVADDDEAEMKQTRWQTPKTPEEWQFCVEMAHFSLLVDAARQYGLIEGGPVINPERCVELLKAGKSLGYRPAPDAVERGLAIFQAGEGE